MTCRSETTDTDVPCETAPAATDDDSCACCPNADGVCPNECGCEDCLPLDGGDECTVAEASAGRGTPPPRDLHELLALLSPGWVWSNDRFGLWRTGCAMWVRSAGFSGRVEAFGGGLRWEGHVTEVLGYLQKMGAA